MIVLYQWMLKIFGWNTFVPSQPDGLRPAAAKFQHLFNTLGLSSAAATLMIVTILSVCAYYFVWNRGSSSAIKYRYRIGWWLLFLFVTALFVALATNGVMHLFMQGQGIQQFHTNAYWAVALCNFLYSLLVFFGASVFVAKVFAKHTNASCTPF